MLISHNNVNTLYKIPVRDAVTGEESILELHNTSLIGAVIDQLQHGQFKVVLHEKLSLSPADVLVFDHAILVQRTKNEILYLKAVVNRGIVIHQMTPGKQRQKRLERLLKLEEPKFIVLAGPVVCTGCKETIPEKTRSLQVRGGVCCDYACFGRMLAAKQAHGG